MIIKQKIIPWLLAGCVIAERNIHTLVMRIGFPNDSGRRGRRTHLCHLQSNAAQNGRV